MITRLWTAVVAAVALLCCLPATLAALTDQYVTYTGDDGDTVYLLDDRKPSLYTGNFGDCLGDSLINVTRFDAAYYQDNMTVLFHLEGSSGLTNESLMMYIGVFAYGESRFDLVFNPCAANIASLCPLNSSVPISADGIIPVAESDVANIPSIAYSIPDFEGEAILRIFANSTESEIGCYSAVVTNGNSFSQPASVGTLLGIFTFVAMLASFATAVYGEAVPTMRLHYAHSLSVGVVFAVFQHIFFTGALSVNWPSVLVAWWSNFAWAGGMIYSSSMQRSIDHLIGNNVGNTSQVGAASSGTAQNNLGGGYDISMIYKRAYTMAGNSINKHPLLRNVASEIYRRTPGTMLKRDVLQHYAQHALARRDIANSTTGYKWYGHAVGAGLPLPGNYSGFAGTLAEEGIRTSNAFMTGFLWLLILIVLLVGALVAFKWALEGLARVKWVKQDRLKFFRDHWLGYSASLALRIYYLAFFMMMLLTMFQFTYSSSGGVKAIAAIVFIVFFIGIPLAAAYAVLYKLHIDTKDERATKFRVERKTLMGRVPWFAVTRVHSAAEDGEQNAAAPGSKSTKPFWRRMSSFGSTSGTQVDQYSIHDNEEYIIKFGWLAARFRRTRWWFFTVWIFYEFLRAIFYGGASGYPLAQVFGLLVIEFLAFLFIIWTRPFEGQRLNVLVVYCLGFSKVASVALSAAFDTQFNLQRIITTVIGIVIIVIQGLLTIVTMIAIIVGAISSYMSVSRNHADFKPKRWQELREKYFDHLDRVVNDLPPEPKPKSKPAPSTEPEEPKEPYFEMKSVRRQAKIEDEDTEIATEMYPQDPAASYHSINEDIITANKGSNVRDGPESGAVTPVGAGSKRARSRATSMQSFSQTNLPFGARSHRQSWSTRDFSDYYGGDGTFSPLDMSRDVPDEDDAPQPPAARKSRHSWTPSRNSTIQNDKVRAQASNDSLRVGGKVSTRDTIGDVPPPAVRPRAGTIGSTHSGRQAPSFGAGSSTDRLGDVFSDAQAQPGSQRNSRHPLLTPANEQEEWLVNGRAPVDQ
ncbi:ML-like domain [Teratosphaeria destructans]|uniref:ML-like domain n=1 Tax=Teratosphaeria destructans TaxID=418781 RepID=A0A9W7SQE8_9PEZI|nr:ML-like domain [Teratosphaeria destructans]